MQGTNQGGGFCTWLAYKCLHTNHFAAQFPHPSCTISTTVPAIPTTLPNPQNQIKCGHCTETCSHWLSFMVIKSPKHNHDNGELCFNTVQAKKISYHFWLLHLNCHHLRQPMEQSERQQIFFACRAALQSSAMSCCSWQWRALHQHSESKKSHGWLFFAIRALKSLPLPWNFCNRQMYFVRCMAHAP